MFFDLLVSGFAWINGLLDRFDLGVVVCLDIDLLTFLDVEEHVVATRLLTRHVAEVFATFARA